MPRARHCGTPAILPSMSLKNAPSAGIQACPQKSKKEFLLFKPGFRIKRNPLKGSNLDFTCFNDDKCCIGY